MNRVIWLKTARVYATDSDMTAKVERSTVKLEDGDNWLKFIKYLPLKGYKKDEQPVIEKVIEKQNGVWSTIDPQPWIDQLNEALKIEPIPGEKIDFKVLAEKQANQLKEANANFKALEERLKALEAQKVEPKQEATAQTEKEIRSDLFKIVSDLGINVAKNIKTDELKKIVEQSTKS